MAPETAVAVVAEEETDVVIVKTVLVMVSKRFGRLCILLRNTS